MSDEEKEIEENEAGVEIRQLLLIKSTCIGLLIENDCFDEPVKIILLY